MDQFQFLMPQDLQKLQTPASPQLQQPFSLLTPEEQQQMQMAMLPGDPSQQQPLLTPTSPQAQPSAQPGPNYEQDFDKAFKQTIGDRKAMLDQLKQKAKEVQAEKPQGLAAIDLKPFLMATDSLGVTKNQSFNYQGNPEVKDNENKAEKLQQQIMTGSDKLSDDQLGYLKSKALEAKMKNAGDKQTLGNEFRLRDDWNKDPITKNTKTVGEGYNKILEAYNGGNDPATYMTMVYGLMKMQDPSSTVREGEFKTGEGIGGWPEQWKAMWQKARGDAQGPITALQKQSIVNQAQHILDAQMAAQAPVNSKYKSLAVDYGMNPQHVVLDDIFQSAQARKAPSKNLSFEQWKTQKGITK
jgi:hypothetical protein